jgi:hypothetical protein
LSAEASQDGASGAGSTGATDGGRALPQMAWPSSARYVGTPRGRCTSASRWRCREGDNARKDAVSHRCFQDAVSHLAKMRINSARKDAVSHRCFQDAVSHLAKMRIKQCAQRCGKPPVLSRCCKSPPQDAGRSRRSKFEAALQLGLELRSLRGRLLRRRSEDA